MAKLGVLADRSREVPLHVNCSYNAHVAEGFATSKAKTNRQEARVTIPGRTPISTVHNHPRQSTIEIQDKVGLNWLQEVRRATSNQPKTAIDIG